MKILNKLDNYFYKSTKKDFLYIILAAVFLIGFIYFYFIYPRAKNFEVSKQNTYTHFVQALNHTKIQLNIFRVQKIKLSNQLKVLSSELINLKKQKAFYLELTNLLDFAEFNKQKWANYVKNIIFEAKNEGMKVKLIENKIYDGHLNNSKLKIFPNNIIVKKMSIGIKLNGNYRNFLHYVYKYENIKDLMRVEAIDITSKNSYYVKFTLYGYKK